MPASEKPVLTEPFVLYQSSLLSTYAKRLIHGFTGKPLPLGGPDWPAELIQENRRALCLQVGLNAEHLILPRQTHTDRFRLNNERCDEACDAVIITESGIPAMVQVADCVPVILYDPERHVGAAIHAGWRGTAQSIAQKVAQSLIKAHQVSASSLIAVIGPAIGGCCYEVSGEVAEAVSKTVPAALSSQYQALQANGKPRIDLQWVNQLQLEALGVSRVERIQVCTRCETSALWSYRRQENGRQVAFLQLY